MERLDEEELKEEDREEVLSLQMAKDRISNSGHTPQTELDKKGLKMKTKYLTNSEQKLSLTQKSEKILQQQTVSSRATQNLTLKKPHHRAQQSFD